jgi:2-dehydro-3-deoxygluconokinase
MTPDMFDWEAIFSDCDWFHFSGITPVLSDTAAHTVQVAVEEARRHGLRTSCDINYRSVLWAPEQAAQVVRPLVRGITCIFGNEADARDVFDIGAGCNKDRVGRDRT